jgi:hypothetical protein
MGHMSDSSERMASPALAAQSDASEHWGNPPLWSPWNFGPKPHLEWEKHLFRAAHASARAGNENN